MKSQDVNYLEIFESIDFDKIIDHPNILIAAHFWDTDRYNAAKICYKLMRCIDDLVDNYKTEHPVITENEKTILINDVTKWINSLNSRSEDELGDKTIFETFNTFKIPIWPMEDFATSMIYDINHDGFASLQTFLDYSRGASVAPASIFVHLCGVTYQNSQYIPPSFDVKEAATPCAIFSYLVHIIRDFQKDQFNNLNYFANDIIKKNGLDRNKLSEMAHGGKIEEGFRNLIGEYYMLADEYRTKTYRMIQKISPLLTPRYQLSLEIIFNLYLMVFERINVRKSNFTADELNPTAKEVKKMVYETILKCQHTLK